MKKIIYLIFVVAAFSACKSKSSMESNKEMITLGDSSYSGSYLTDTGAVANADEFINAGGVISGKATVAEAPVASTSRKRTSTSSGSTARRSGTSSGGGSGTTTTTTNQKKGMSKAAQGAVIGGVGGAVAGAVIGKSGKGAVVGGVVGAAGGYIIGRSKDRKSGRVQ